MAYWLIKSEPDAWSWDSQVKSGKPEAWTGVRNHTAKQYLQAMKKGDRAFFYHTGDEKAVIGVAKALSDGYPDPKQKDEKAVSYTHLTLPTNREV